MTTSDERVARLETSVLELRTELQKFRIEAARDNADLARGIKDEFRRLDGRLDDIMALLRSRPLFRWPWEPVR